jgi:carbonic anhydrase/acetyltransferase-like protein (isoleucine patch superfamily)
MIRDGLKIILVRIKQASCIRSFKNMIKNFLEKSPKIHETAFIAETATIIGDVEIRAESSVWYGTILRGDVNYIRIGARTNIQDASVIHVSSKTHPTVLEDEITVGHSVTLHGCRVEKGCLIGIGSIILDGARIGRNSLVAAGSLVTPGSQIPEKSLVMGSPARVKRALTDEEVKGLEKFWRNYIALSRIYRASY